jgi:hypothetical protein
MFLGGACPRDHRVNVFCGIAHLSFLKSAKVLKWGKAWHKWGVAVDLKARAILSEE